GGDETLMIQAATLLQKFTSQDIDAPGVDLTPLREEFAQLRTALGGPPTAAATLDTATISLADMRALLADRIAEGGGEAEMTQAAALLKQIMASEMEATDADLTALRQEFAKLHTALAPAAMTQAVAQGVAQGAQKTPLAFSPVEKPGT